MEEIDNQGIIEVKGKAERKIDADIVKYVLCFQAKDLYLSKAIETVDKHCEIFLGAIETLGVDNKRIMLLDDSIDERQYDEGNMKSVKRMIGFQINVSAAFHNALLDIIQSNDLNVQLSVDYSYSHANELAEELVKEAVINSRKMAQLIAEANHQKVIGIHRVTDDIFDRKIFFCEDDDDDDDWNEIPAFIKKRRSDDLATKKLTISESVKIQWRIE